MAPRVLGRCARARKQHIRTIANPEGPSCDGPFSFSPAFMRIALPNKGRLADDSRELLADAGLDLRVRGERALTASLGGAFEAIFVRAEDIPEFVSDGAA